MLVDPPRERDLFSNLGTCWTGEEDLCQISFHAHHPTACGRGTNVDHQQFVLGELLHLGLLLVVGFPLQRFYK